MSQADPSSSLDRRTFLRVAGAASLGLPALLAACGAESAPAGSTAASTAGAGSAGASAVARASAPASGAASAPAAAKSIFPTHLPIPGPQPELPASDAGLVPGYLAFPKNLYKSVATAPGRGGPVTALTTSHKPPQAPLDQNTAWQELNKQLNAQINITRIVGTDFPAKIATMAAGNDVPDLFLWDSNQLLIDDMLKFVKTAYADLTPYLSGDTSRPTQIWPPSAHRPGRRACSTTPSMACRSRASSPTTSGSSTNLAGMPSAPASRRMPTTSSAF